MFPQVFGKYVLERELSSGGMAVVYLATLRGAGGFEKRLVVKQIRADLASDEAFVQRFVAEAKTTVELSHPNIVPVYELGVEQGVYFIAMELAHGVTLSELLHEGGPLSPEEGAYLGVEMCRALDYAHRRAGVVHRDVTPRNVIIDEEGAVRLIDFGIAAPVSTEGAARERVYGSPGHMPIEQLRGGRLTPATDVFAVGALLVEAWTGAPPFRRATREESDAALEEPLPPLAEKTPGLLALGDLVSRALRFDAAERPQSAEDLARPLREFLRAEDLGDLARRLGGRVRSALAAKGASVEHATDRPGTPATRRLPSPSGRPPPPSTPPTRPITQSVTEVFAAREEVVEWTATPSAPPPETAAIVGSSESTGLVVAADLKRRVRVSVAVLSVLGLAAVMLSSRHATGPETLRVPAPVASPFVAPPAPAASAPAPSVSAAAPQSSAEPAPAPAGSVAEPARVQSAALSFTSDLPARVAVDGAFVGVTPLRGVKRAPGKHVVSLVNGELDEHLTAQVDAEAGQAVSVHAEFTRPVPTLRIR